MSLVERDLSEAHRTAARATGQLALALQRRRLRPGLLADLAQAYRSAATQLERTAAAAESGDAAGTSPPVGRRVT